MILLINLLRWISQSWQSEFSQKIIFKTFPSHFDNPRKFLLGRLEMEKYQRSNENFLDWIIQDPMMSEFCFVPQPFRNLVKFSKNLVFNSILNVEDWITSCLPLAGSPKSIG